MDPPNQDGSGWEGSDDWGWIWCRGLQEGGARIAGPATQTWQIQVYPPDGPCAVKKWGPSLNFFTPKDMNDRKLRPSGHNHHGSYSWNGMCSSIKTVATRGYNAHCTPSHLEAPNCGDGFPTMGSSQLVELRTKLQGSSSRKNSSNVRLGPATPSGAIHGCWERCQRYPFKGVRPNGG